MSCCPSPKIGICGRCGQKDFLGADGDCHPDFYTNCYKNEKDSKMRRNYQPEVENSMLFKAFSAGYSVGQTDVFGLVKAAEVLKNAFRFWLEEFTHDPEKEQEICPRCGVDANHCADFCDSRKSRAVAARRPKPGVNSRLRSSSKPSSAEHDGQISAGIGQSNSAFTTEAKVERTAPEDTRGTE